MSTIIKDGTGDGNTAKVGEQNRLHTHSLAATTSSVATSNGDAFDVSTGIITLTSDSESDLIYIKNNEDKDIAITKLFITLSSSTGGTGTGYIHFYINPDGGTVITDETEASLFNRRIGDSNTLDADTFKGAEAKTLTCSVGCIAEAPTVGGIIDSEFVLPKGASFGMGYTPPSGNTSIDIQMAVVVIKDQPRYTIE